MEFQINDLVIYGSAGVCRIVAEEEQSMDGKTYVKYYKLKPISEQNSTYYIPVTAAADKLRRLLPKEEVLALIESMPESTAEADLWKENRRERKEMYSQILHGDDRKALLQLISSLYSKKQDKEARGKHFSTMDETAMKNAENLMLQEFGAVLGMEPEKVRNVIAARFNA
ncbi:MAG: CarD family transcriptional regulator [Oscillospiraceae bacterium]|nr:CarD family transcriptional regulator [Oscillospiraceae bacterium]